MSEQELKLHVPRAARAAVRRELELGKATRIRLQALYFDTPARELAKARVAIRLRKEGRQWVQTLKTPGDHALARIELNHDRPGPVLDLSVYADTAVAPVLAGLQGELSVRYETDVTRLLRRIRTRQGTVEVAYDSGCLRAGALELPICEVEFELVSGRFDAVFDLGRRWQRKHALVLDLRSKSERGDALARTAQALAALPEPHEQKAAARIVRGFWAPWPAGSAVLTPDMSPEQAQRAVAYECLEQVVRNATVLAETDTDGVYAAGHPDHVHQLRVGMRRLRSAWRLFKGWADAPSDELIEATKRHFADFGQSRDADVLRDTVLPTLVRAGMPAITLPESSDDTDARAKAASQAFQGWLLDMLAWTLGLESPAPAKPQAAGLAVSQAASASSAADNGDEAGGQSHPGSLSANVEIIPLGANGEAPPEPEPPRLRALLEKRLHKWHKELVAEGEHFRSLEIEARHDLRKRGKRLRYGLLFAEPLLSSNRLKAYRKELSRAQDILGEMNDLYVAETHFETLTAGHPQAWFARGWITARLDALSTLAEQAFADLGKVKPFWK